MKKTIRRFVTGATRDSNENKLEYARFLDPRVLRAYAEYMHTHRVQSDGTLRDPDNWKKGMSRGTYLDSLERHVMDLWELHDYGVCIRPEDGKPVTVMGALCGIMFNTMGWMFEELQKAGRRIPRAAA